MECTCSAGPFIKMGINNEFLTYHEDYCIVNAPSNNNFSIALDHNWDAKTTKRFEELTKGIP